MNPEIKTKWIAALKSGEYEQGTGYLKHYNTYCCLGVLCDIHAKETGNSFVEGCYFGQNRVLPEEVIKWSKLGSSCGTYRAGGVTYTLWELNDVEGLSFNEIANIIEKEF